MDKSALFGVLHDADHRHNCRVEEQFVRRKNDWDVDERKPTERRRGGGVNINNSLNPEQNQIIILHFISFISNDILLTTNNNLVN